MPYYQQPLFTRHAGKVSFRYVRTHLRSAQRFADVPPMTAEQEAALDHLDELARSPAFHLEFMFQPGDIHSSPCGALACLAPPFSRFHRLRQRFNVPPP